MQKYLQTRSLAQCSATGQPPGNAPLKFVVYGPNYCVAEPARERHRRHRAPAMLRKHAGKRPAHVPCWREINVIWDPETRVCAIYHYYMVKWKTETDKKIYNLLLYNLLPIKTENNEKKY